MTTEHRRALWGIRIRAEGDRPGFDAPVAGEEAARRLAAMSDRYTLISSDVGPWHVVDDHAPDLIVDDDLEQWAKANPSYPRELAVRILDRAAEAHRRGAIVAVAAPDEGLQRAIYTALYDGGATFDAESVVPAVEAAVLEHLRDRYQAGGGTA